MSDPALKDAVTKVIESLEAAILETEVPYHLLGDREFYKVQVLEARSHMVKAEIVLKLLEKELSK